MLVVETDTQKTTEARGEGAGAARGQAGEGTACRAWGAWVWEEAGAQRVPCAGRRGRKARPERRQTEGTGNKESREGWSETKRWGEKGD